ncbi:hypothetical protein EVAR_34434_1 [Eumeta japonica]|uniref:Uncharacterized protein n=1 Tax=Eumeta variegata TaxID=151549 RepID=A0A4C1WJF5_EUMVA|nr:hypothetical protein EVAR_34434_1 [Eumeta japonica]
MALTKYALQALEVCDLDTVVCGRCLSSTRTHRPMEWKKDRSFRVHARTLGSMINRLLGMSTTIMIEGGSRSGLQSRLQIEPKSFDSKYICNRGRSRSRPESELIVGPGTESRVRSRLKIMVDIVIGRYKDGSIRSMSTRAETQAEASYHTASALKKLQYIQRRWDGRSTRYTYVWKGRNLQRMRFRRPTLPSIDSLSMGCPLPKGRRSSSNSSAVCLSMDDDDYRLSDELQARLLLEN